MSRAKHLIIIGAQRSGTTQLYGMLNSHDAIQMAEPYFPEPKYFLTADNPTYSNYLEKHFSEIRSGVEYLGEKSTSYYERIDIIPLIKHVLGMPRVIIQLRDPVERALSNYHFSVKNGLETRSLREVFIEKKTPPQLNFKVSVDPFDYLGRGEYLKYVRPYTEAFQDNLILLRFEDTIGGNTDELWSTLKLERPSELDVKSEFRNPSDRNVQDEEVVEFLREYYAPHIQDLETYTNQEFEIWK